MPTVEQKFATFMSLLTPEEQRAVAPLMQTFAGALGTPGGAGDPAPTAPAPEAAPVKPPLPPPQTAIPGGPPLPPPEANPGMSIGRQMY